ncbi:4Fe-4S binding protein [Syntrophorhabdus aromaticivorans]|uniref:4Fe-4S binding protein n=1 Tax=Syntrophorhabdus aromaticivorans TaxID=328301 RepID=A0A971M3E4_9BACT|nr:4Fe-4S dicluster domain-containing protein [Syntrophorhabdus aromaticivorans]NLW34979.1 4Fe-4S binding protein [Syntrophorhabdus aromaticivorans]
MKGKRVDITMIEAGLNRFLADDRNLVLGFAKEPDGVSHRIFKKELSRFSLLNPYFGINGAFFLRRIFSKGQRLLLFLRPCEIRASVELIKLTQIEREGIIAVSVDCFGALSSKDSSNGFPDDHQGIADALRSSEKVRTACKTCKERRGVVGNGGIRFGRDGTLWAVSYDDKGDEFCDLFPGDHEELPAVMLVGEGTKAEPFSSDMTEFSKDFSKCIMCMNCRDMCPVCYCIDCVFNGSDYLPRGDALLNKIFRGGTTSLPSGKELFHLIRMFHVSQTCVGCGACEEACPQGIPLTRYFKGISERLQGMFSYTSGRSVEEPIPYLTFLEDELNDAAD